MFKEFMDIFYYNNLLYTKINTQMYLYFTVYLKNVRSSLDSTGSPGDHTYDYNLRMNLKKKSHLILA